MASLIKKCQGEADIVAYLRAAQDSYLVGDGAILPPREKAQTHS
jgi:hypothetical protein